MYLWPIYLRSFARAVLKSSDVFSSIKASPLGRPSLEKVKHTPSTFPMMSQSARLTKRQLVKLADETNSREETSGFDVHLKKTRPLLLVCMTKVNHGCAPHNPRHFETSLINYFWKFPEINTNKNTVRRRTQYDVLRFKYHSL